MPKLLTLWWILGGTLALATPVVYFYQHPDRLEAMLRDPVFYIVAGFLIYGLRRALR